MNAAEMDTFLGYPRRLLPGDRQAYLYPLLEGARICVGKRDDLSGYDAGY